MVDLILCRVEIKVANLTIHEERDSPYACVNVNQPLKKAFKKSSLKSIKLSLLESFCQTKTMDLKIVFFYIEAFTRYLTYIFLNSWLYTIASISSTV